jgi:cytochrome c oxidase assembly factor CtaG
MKPPGRCMSTTITLFLAGMLIVAAVVILLYAMGAAAKNVIKVLSKKK